MLDNLFTPTHLIILLVLPFLVVLVPFWQIWKKAGFSPLLSILMMIPVVGIVMLYVLAFTQWKVMPVQGGYPQSARPPQV
jgi:hypothetical protein